MVSERALNVATRISLSGFFHQLGMRPHRIGISTRFSSPRTTTSTVSVGQTLKLGCRLEGVDVSEYIAWICAQV
jgi:hypothetical protein